MALLSSLLGRNSFCVNSIQLFLALTLGLTSVDVVAGQLKPSQVTEPPLPPGLEELLKNPAFVQAMAAQEIKGESAVPSLSATPHGPTINAYCAKRSQSIPKLSSNELAAINAADLQRTDGVFRIGVKRPFVNPVVINSSRLQKSEWTTLSNGWNICSIDISSPGAHGMFIPIESLKLPSGTRLVVYGSDKPGKVVDVVTSESLKGLSKTSVGPVFGDKATIECQVPPNIDPTSTELSVDGVTYIYRVIQLPGIPSTLPAAPCENDATCYPAWAREAAGVGCVVIPLSDRAEACSGVLLNTYPTSFANYFLTVNHVVPDQDTASQIRVYWFYQSDTCNGNAPIINNSTPYTSGADYLAGASPGQNANNPTGADFSFLKLRGNVPDGVCYAGWTTTPLSSAAPADLVTCIHHPMGDYKRISFGLADGTYDKDYYLIQWDLGGGMTESGSSGAPLFNVNHQLVGLLSSTPANESCDNPYGPDRFGRFDKIYPIIMPWLNPQLQYTATDLGNVSTIGGINNKNQIALSRNTTGSTHATVYDDNTGIFTDIGTLDNSHTGIDSGANDINDSGQVVGGSGLYNSLGTTCPPGGHPFEYKNGTMIDLGIFPIAGEGYYPNFPSARRINSQGSAIGVTAKTLPPAPHDCPLGMPEMFLYQNGSLHDMGNSSQLNAINDAGQVVGSKRVGSVTQAAILAGNNIGPIAAFDGITSVANDINEAGQIVGQANDQAFLYDIASGSATYLGTLGDYSLATRINEPGIVIGDISVGAPGNIVLHPFIYADRRMKDLNNCISSSGLTLVSVGGLNDLNCITALAQDSEYVVHGVLLKPINSCLGTQKLVPTMTVLNNGLNMSWQGIAGQRYLIHKTDDLTQGWSILANILATQTGPMSFSPPMTGSQGFFKIEVPQP